MTDIDPRVAIKALDNLSKSVGWRIIAEWATDKRASKMQALIGAGVSAQHRDELAAEIRQLNLVLEAPTYLMGGYADQIETEGGTDG